MRSIVYPLVRTYLRLYHIVFRPITLGVRALVINEAGEVLLVKHTYTPGWHLPGGALDRGETLLEGAVREIQEETAVSCSAEDAAFIGMFGNFAESKNDHIALYLFRLKNNPTIDRKPDFEIACARFFSINELPPDLSRGTSRRIEEHRSGGQASQQW